MVNRFRRGFAAVLVLVSTTALAQFAPSQGEFSSSGLTAIQLDSQLCTGWWRQASWKCEPIKVPAYMAVPQQPNGNVVIVSHGSQGIDAMHRWYLNALQRAGYHAIAIDHFKPRGLRVALARAGYARTSLGNGGNALNMAIDTMAAAQWIRAQPQFANAKIGHIGESMGAGVARELNRDGISNLLDSVLQTKSRPLDAYVGMYLGCLEKSTTDRFQSKPVLLISGTADEITPIEPCRTYVKWANDRGGNFTLIEVPRAHHQFDSWYKLGYWGDIENQRNCASTANPQAGVYVADATGKSYPFNAQGFADFRRDCIVKGAHAGNETPGEGVGFDRWLTFFATTLK